MSEQRSHTRSAPTCEHGIPWFAPCAACRDTVHRRAEEFDAELERNTPRRGEPLTDEQVTGEQP